MAFLQEFPLSVFGHAAVLTVVDPLALRWAIVAVVFALLALIISGWKYPGAPTPPVTVGVGLTSGVLSGAAQIGGPPVVVYLLDHHAVRANIVLYFAVQSVFSAISYSAGGLITRDVLFIALFVTPVFATAIWFGSKMFSRSNEQFFRYVCYGLIALAAFIGLPLWDSLQG
jgi:uncharacterized membrane protein YfcA